MGILDLEAASGGPFVYQHEGASHSLPNPDLMTLEEIVSAIRSEGRLLVSPVRMPLWKATEVMKAWALHHGLGEPREVQRLLYVLDKHHAHIEYDLHAHAGVDMQTLWRGRRWRKLLNLIDHLPRHSYYSEAVANDPEHAKMLAKANAEREAAGEEKKKYTPPMTQWTPEVSAIADLIDSVNAMNYTLKMVNSDPKKRAPKPPDPYARPQTALEGATKRAKFERRQAKHDALVARLLPHKAQAGKSDD